MNDIYMRIEDLCKNHEIDITRMCKEAGVSRAIMSEFKMGRTKKLSTVTLEKLSNYFSVPIDYLLTGEEIEQKNKPIIAEDDELNEYLEMLRTRPELRMMFNLAKGATKADVEKSVKIIEAFLADK